LCGRLWKADWTDLLVMMSHCLRWNDAGGTADGRAVTGRRGLKANRLAKRKLASLTSLKLTSMAENNIWYLA